MHMQLFADAAPYFFGGFFVLILLAFLLTTAFWLWMLVDSINNRRLDSNERMIWAVAIFFTHLIGAILYFLLARNKPGPAA